MAGIWIAHAAAIASISIQQKPGLVTVPGKPGDDLAAGTLNSVLGCVATGKSRDEVEREMQEAIEFHIEGMARNGDSIPEPRTYSR